MTLVIGHLSVVSGQTYSADLTVIVVVLARRAADRSPRREPWGIVNKLPQPGGRHIEGSETFIEVSPSGLIQHLRHSTHGSRRGLQPAALRAEDLTSAYSDETAMLSRRVL